VAAVLAFALGCFGFYGSGYRDWTDIAYNALALFVLNFPGGAREGTQVSVVLDIARFVAPIVTGTAAISALLALFREQVQQRRIRRMRNHIVICGLGYVGSVFVSHLDDPKTGVVVIDADPDSLNREVCRSLGVPVIVGDAQLQRTLEAAGVKHAAKLVALCPDDAVNTEIVSVARQIAPNLNCLARIGDPELCVLLRIQEFRENKRHTQESALDFFNTDEISARALLDAKPIDATSGRAHILVAHLDPMGVWLTGTPHAGGSRTTKATARDWTSLSWTTTRGLESKHSWANIPTSARCANSRTARRVPETYVSCLSCAPTPHHSSVPM
jgi:hypothetical protein